MGQFTYVPRQARYCVIRVHRSAIRSVCYPCRESWAGNPANYIAVILVKESLVLRQGSTRRAQSGGPAEGPSMAFLTSGMGGPP